MFGKGASLTSLGKEFMLRAQCVKRLFRKNLYGVLEERICTPRDKGKQ